MRFTNSSRRDRRNRQRRSGFTLLEIIVVVTIIALLATLVAPRLLKNVAGAKRKAAQAEVASIAQQVKLWLLDQGLTRVPDDFELEMLTEGSDPYLKQKDLLDPWDFPYVIVVPGEENIDFDIVSYGADGERGGEADGEDIVNQ